MSDKDTYTDAPIRYTGKQGRQQSDASHIRKCRSMFCEETAFLVQCFQETEKKTFAIGVEKNDRKVKF